MARPSRVVFSALVALVGLVFALGCGGYSIKIEPPPATTEAVVEVAPVTPVPAPAPATTAPKPKPSTAPAPAPAPAPDKRGSGQIQVTTAAAVQAFVDGVPVPFTAEQGYVVEVTAGTHALEIYNLVGALVASREVEVPAGQRVRFSYKPKTLTEMSTVATSPIPPPMTMPEPAPAPAPALPGSVEITGLAAYGDAVFVDGYAARYDAWQTSYISSGLTPGSHDLRVEIDRRVVYSGAVDVRSGENHRCVASWDGWEWTLDCHWTRPAL